MRPKLLAAATRRKRLQLPFFLCTYHLGRNAEDVKPQKEERQVRSRSCDDDDLLLLLLFFFDSRVNYALSCLMSRFHLTERRMASPAGCRVRDRCATIANRLMTKKSWQKLSAGRLAQILIRLLPSDSLFCG